MSPQTPSARPYITLGIGIIAFIALIIAIGDPGEEERKQLTSSLNEAQENTRLLEEKLTQQDANMRQQAELIQQLLHKIEANEDHNAMMKTRLDDMEKSVARLKQQQTAKAVVSPKPVIKTPAKPVVVSKSTAKSTTTATKATTAVKH